MQKANFLINFLSVVETPSFHGNFKTEMIENKLPLNKVILQFNSTDTKSKLSELKFECHSTAYLSKDWFRITPNGSLILLHNFNIYVESLYEIYYLPISIMNPNESSYDKRSFTFIQITLLAYNYYDAIVDKSRFELNTDNNFTVRFNITNRGDCPFFEIKLKELSNIFNAYFDEEFLNGVLTLAKNVTIQNLNRMYEVLYLITDCNDYNTTGLFEIFIPEARPHSFFYPYEVILKNDVIKFKNNYTRQSNDSKITYVILYDRNYLYQENLLDFKILDRIINFKVRLVIAKNGKYKYKIEFINLNQTISGNRLVEYQVTDKYNRTFKGSLYVFIGVNKNSPELILNERKGIEFNETNNFTYRVYVRDNDDPELYLNDVKLRVSDFSGNNLRVLAKKTEECEDIDFYANQCPYDIILYNRDDLGVYNLTYTLTDGLHTKNGILPVLIKMGGDDISFNMKIMIVIVSLILMFLIILCFFSNA